ncbi:unnamed protein product [Symbiodinium natans]|uniref:OTU domain-containing protein n=1 Tax=Symbiodinium natans TaxID=878477 RepID=A0A812PJI5_9DINO|nr:unnamed protein product [Symbiodinium natans]
MRFVEFRSAKRAKKVNGNLRGESAARRPMLFLEMVQLPRRPTLPPRQGLPSRKGGPRARDRSLPRARARSAVSFPLRVLLTQRMASKRATARATFPTTKARASPLGMERAKGRAVVTPLPFATPLLRSGGLEQRIGQGNPLYDQLGDYSGAGESLWFLAEDATQAEAAQCMVASGGFKSSLLVLWRDDKGPNQLPFWHNGQVRLLRTSFSSHPVSNVAVPGLKGEQKAKKAVKIVPTSVLRAICVRDFASRESWTQAQRDFKQYVQSRVPHVKDVWGTAAEERHGKVLVALVRIATDQREAMLVKSGMDGLFWETVSREDDDKKYHVRWHEKRDGETDAVYLQRCIAAKPKHGLIVGRRQIGERVVHKPEEVIRSWRLADTPCDWTQDTIADLLAGSGLTDMTVTSRITRRGVATWFLRAACKEDLVVINAEVGKETKAFYVLPTFVARQGFIKRTVLKQDNTFTFKHESFRVVPGTATAVNKDAEELPDASAKEESQAKRLAVASRAAPDGVTLVEIARDGNCLPNAIAKGLAWNKGSAKVASSRQIRGELISYMQRKLTHYEAYWDGRDTSDRPDTLSSFQDYLKEAALDGKYLGHLEIDAACRLFGLTVYVIPTLASDPPVRHGSGSYVMAFQFEPGASGIGHYDFFEPSDRDAGYPAVISTIQEIGATSGGRGGGERAEGGGSSEEDVPLTLYSTGSVGQGRAAGEPSSGSIAGDEVALTTYTSVDGQLVRRQALEGKRANDIRAWFGPLFAAGARRPVASLNEAEAAAASDCDSQDLGGVEVPKVAAQQKGRKGKRTHWQCKFCPYRTPLHAKGAYLNTLRHLHLRSWHLDRKEQWSSKAKYGVRVIEDVTAAEADAVQTRWKCPHCPAGILDDGVPRGRGAEEAITRACNQHMRWRHPSEKPVRRRPRANNSGKATAAKIAAGVAAKVLRAKKGDFGDHKVEILRIPCLGSTAKKKRNTSTCLVCKTCGSYGHAAASLRQYPCNSARVAVGHKRASMIKKFQEALEADYAEGLKNGLRRVLQIFEEVEARQQEKGEGDAQHHVQVFAWPSFNKGSGNYAYAVRFLCLKCHEESAKLTQLTARPCSTVGRRRKDKRIRDLQQIAAKAEDPPKSAAMAVLVALGEESVEKATSPGFRSETGNLRPFPCISGPSAEAGPGRRAAERQS